MGRGCLPYLIISTKMDCDGVTDCKKESRLLPSRRGLMLYNCSEVLAKLENSLCPPPTGSTSDDFWEPDYVATIGSATSAKLIRHQPPRSVFIVLEASSPALLGARGPERQFSHRAAIACGQGLAREFVAT